MNKSGLYLGYFICRYCNTQHAGDRRKVCCDEPECQKKWKFESNSKSRKAGVIKKSKTNPCIICGRDKKGNRYYCSVCHRKVSNSVDDKYI